MAILILRRVFPCKRQRIRFHFFPWQDFVFPAQSTQIGIKCFDDQISISSRNFLGRSHVWRFGYFKFGSVKNPNAPSEVNVLRNLAKSLTRSICSEFSRPLGIRVCSCITITVVKVRGRECWPTLHGFKIVLPVHVTWWQISHARLTWREGRSLRDRSRVLAPTSVRLGINVWIGLQ